VGFAAVNEGEVATDTACERERLDTSAGAVATVSLPIYIGVLGRRSAMPYATLFKEKNRWSWLWCHCSLVVVVVVKCSSVMESTMEDALLSMVNAVVAVVVDQDAGTCF
jgi:hypothetical protein